MSNYIYIYINMHKSCIKETTYFLTCQIVAPKDEEEEVREEQEAEDHHHQTRILQGRQANI